MSESELWKEIRELQAQVNELRSINRPDKTIFAKYKTTAGQTVATGDTDIINFDTKIADQYNCVTTGAAWKFTAPRYGTAFVFAKIQTAANAGWAVGEITSIASYKNGVFNGEMDGDMNLAANSRVWLAGSIPITMNAGDYIDVRWYQNSGGNVSLSKTDLYCWISIALLRTY